MDYIAQGMELHYGERIKELEAKLEEAEMFEIQYRDKLAIAVEALDFYAKQTGCECSPSYVPVRAIEALKNIKAAF